MLENSANIFFNPILLAEYSDEEKTIFLNGLKDFLMILNHDDKYIYLDYLLNVIEDEEDIYKIICLANRFTIFLREYVKNNCFMRLDKSLIEYIYLCKKDLRIIESFSISLTDLHILRLILTEANIVKERWNFSYDYCLGKERSIDNESHQERIVLLS